LNSAGQEHSEKCSSTPIAIISENPLTYVGLTFGTGIVDTFAVLPLMVIAFIWEGRDDIVRKRV